MAAAEAKRIIIGPTTIYGNVYTTLVTRNALLLLEVVDRTDIPVAEGSHVTITNGTKLRIVDFVHGADVLAVRINDTHQDVEPTYGLDNSWYLFTEKWIKIVYGSGWCRFNSGRGFASGNNEDISLIKRKCRKKTCWLWAWWFMEHGRIYRDIVLESKCASFK